MAYETYFFYLETFFTDETHFFLESVCEVRVVGVAGHRWWCVDANRAAWGMQMVHWCQKSVNYQLGLTILQSPSVGWRLAPVSGQLGVSELSKWQRS